MCLFICMKMCWRYWIEKFIWFQIYFLKEKKSNEQNKHINILFTKWYEQKFYCFSEYRNWRASHMFISVKQRIKSFPIMNFTNQFIQLRLTYILRLSMIHIYIFPEDKAQHVIMYTLKQWFFSQKKCNK